MDVIKRSKVAPGLLRLEDKGGRPAQLGERLTHRGEWYQLVDAYTPERKSSTGRVVVEDSDGYQRHLYPSVFKLQWVPYNGVRVNGGPEVPIQHALDLLQYAVKVVEDYQMTYRNEVAQVEVVVRIRRPGPGPHEGGFEWKCPACGEEKEFVGVDDQGVMTQEFSRTEDGELNYDSWDADIGEYTRIDCACGHTIWSRYLA